MHLHFTEHNKLNTAFIHIVMIKIYFYSKIVATSNKCTFRLKQIWFPKCRCVPVKFLNRISFSLLPTARPQTLALSSMADHTHMNKHGLTSAHISILAFQKITSFTGDLRALPLCLSEAGRGGRIKSTLMAHTCGCEKAMRRRSSGRGTQGRTEWVNTHKALM